LLHSTRPELTPKEVLQAARPTDFFPGHQQDSSEFLGHLLETLHEQEKHNLKKPVLPIGKWETQSDLAANAGDEAFGKKADQSAEADKSDAAITLIQKTFAGRIAITNACKECGATNSHFDSFRDLQLSFPDEVVVAKEEVELIGDVKKVHSVQNLLDFYCSTEQLVGDNQYFCDKCRKLCDGERSIQIVEPPKSLILTLKHFRYDQRFHTRAKLMQKVVHDEVIEVPVNGRRLIYSLYAAVIHSGSSLDCGHYYTFATDGKWYKFNDNYVTESSIGELHALAPPNTPYILFYQMSNASHVNTPENDVAPTLCNGTDAECHLDLEELPSHLREFVNKDNISFQEEQRLKKPLVQSWPLMNKKTYRDSDDDPPPNCGDKAIDCHNRYIC
jgi:ubiquitin carboxyl-terminal hydrolase 35/38